MQYYVGIIIHAGFNIEATSQADAEKLAEVFVENRTASEIINEGKNAELYDVEITGVGETRSTELPG